MFGSVLKFEVPPVRTELSLRIVFLVSPCFFVFFGDSVHCWVHSLFVQKEILSNPNMLCMIEILFPDYNRVADYGTSK